MTNTAAATVTAAICDVCAHYVAGFDPADIHADAWPAATMAGPLAYGSNPATIERSDSNLIDACGQCGTAHPRGAYWDIVAMPAAPARRTYRARRIAARFYEYTRDGFTPSEDRTAFNVDAAPYDVEDDTLTFDSVADLVAAIRRDGVTFAAYGDGMTASNPDGSHIIDYATGAREAVSWHLDAVSPALLARVIIPAVDAR